MAHLLIARVLCIPSRQVAHSQIVLIVVEQLFQTSLRHIGQLDFCLARSGGSSIAFRNILFAATRSLNHLVHSAVALYKVVLCKVIGDVVDDFSDLIDPQTAVMAMLGEEGDGGRLGRGRRSRRGRNCRRGRRGRRSRITLTALITPIILTNQIILIIMAILIHCLLSFHSSTSWRNSGISTRFQPTSLRVVRKCS